MEVGRGGETKLMYIAHIREQEDVPVYRTGYSEVAIGHKEHSRTRIYVHHCEGSAEFGRSIWEAFSV
jgi:hypothetical protein